MGENATQDGATGTRMDDVTDWILWNPCNAPGWTSTDNPQPVESNQRVGNNRGVQNLALSDYDADGRSSLALCHSNPADGSAWWIQHLHRRPTRQQHPSRNQRHHFRTRSLGGLTVGGPT